MGRDRARSALAQVDHLSGPYRPRRRTGRQRTDRAQLGRREGGSQRAEPPPLDDLLQLIYIRLQGRGSETKLSVASRVAQRVPGVATAGEQLLAALDNGVERRWQPALDRAAASQHLPVDQRVASVTRVIRAELIATGALTGGIASVPNPASLAALPADLIAVSVRLTDLILTIGAIHGHGQASIEERRLWVLSVLAFGDGAMAMSQAVAREAGIGLGKKATAAIPASALRSLNKALGRTVITKYGTKRGAVALGKLLPFGFGAAIGGGANALTVTAVARSADRFMRQLPYGGVIIDLDPDVEATATP